MTSDNVRLVRCMNKVVCIDIRPDVSVTDRSIRKAKRLICEELRFTEKKFLYGKEKAEAKSKGEPVVEFVVHKCYGFDLKGRLWFYMGFLDRVKGLLCKNGINTSFTDRTPNVKPANTYDTVWHKLDALKIDYRYKQKDIIRQAAATEFGQFKCPGGYGKSFLITSIVSIFPNARFVITSRGKTIIKDQIYPALCNAVPGEVGIICTGKRITNKRVMCVTAKSLGHINPDKVDFLIYDECHEAGADDTAAILSQFTNCRMLGFSASADMRGDGKDMRVEGLFGPVRCRIEYEEAVDNKVITPIKVLWRVVDGADPVPADASDVQLLRYGIWRYRARNEMICQDVRSYSDDVQVLVTVSTIEHALMLKKMLPECCLLYSKEGLEGKDMYGKVLRSKFKRMGVLTWDEPVMTEARQKRIIAGLASGKIKRVIATPMINVGVDLRHCQVVVRADATSSPLRDQQIPYRASRISHVKDVGIIHDYYDEHNKKLARKSAVRERHYSNEGWVQEYIGGASHSGSAIPVSESGFRRRDKRSWKKSI